MTNVVNSFVKRYLIFVIIIILLSGCELFKTQNPSEPDNPPRITTKIPTEYTLNKKVGDTVEFEATAIDADDDTIYYKTLVDDVKVNDLNTYTFNIPDIGVYKVQIVAYNAESDTASWTVNVGNTDPVVSGLYNVNGKEDQIVIGSIVRTANISDHEDSLEELVIELSQTNPDLIKVALDDDNNIIVESYTADGNGSSEITLKVTDTNGGITEKSFAYNITPMTDIEGEILDSDIWEPNNALQGFAIIQGDTVWADATGKYKTQIDPASSINIEAGYRSLDKLNPMSFITTARGVLAGNDVSGVDIMVVTYLNNNLTPEEMRILAWETNFSALDKNYTGAKFPSKDMTDYLVWENYTGDVFTQAEMDDLKKVINDSINVHLKHPFAQVDTSYFRPQTEEERTNVTRWAKSSQENTSIGTLDYNNDGIVDFTTITTRGDNNPTRESFITGLLEEGYGSRGQFGPVTHPSLEGKTIAYEFDTTGLKQADIKFIKFIEGVAREVGYLVPKMPLDDVFKVQE